MNQHSIDKHSHRHSRKRNSYEVVKTTHSLKNAKKSLPEVCIDLNEQHRKNRLALQQRINRGKEPVLEISQFEDKRKSAKTGKKKQSLTLNNIFNTELVRPQNQNKNVLNEYRDEIELLKLENERLKQENDKLKKNDEYYIKRFKQFRQENYIENKQLKAYVAEMQSKVDKYREKIKSLYQELIFQKQKNIEGKQKKVTWTSSTLRDDLGHTKGQIYSYRAEGNNERNQRQRFTSPSSPEMERMRWTQGIDTILRYERKGQEAYYKASGGFYGTLNSDVQ